MGRRDRSRIVIIADLLGFLTTSVMLAALLLLAWHSVLILHR
jgi:hypothetical protein